MFSIKFLIFAWQQLWSWLSTVATHYRLCRIRHLNCLRTNCESPNQKVHRFDRWDYSYALSLVEKALEWGHSPPVRDASVRLKCAWYLYWWARTRGISWHSRMRVVVVHAVSKQSSWIKKQWQCQLPLNFSTCIFNFSWPLCFLWFYACLIPHLLPLLRRFQWCITRRIIYLLQLYHNTLLNFTHTGPSFPRFRLGFKSFSWLMAAWPPSFLIAWLRLSLPLLLWHSLFFSLLLLTHAMGCVVFFRVLLSLHLQSSIEVHNTVAWPDHSRREFILVQTAQPARRQPRPFSRHDGEGSGAAATVIWKQV